MQADIWQAVKGYEGLYEVSNSGKVRRIAGWANNRLPTGEIKQASVKGYKQVTLYKGGHATRYKVHRLVANAFIGNPKWLPQVNHIDGDKANNAACNLEWVTQGQNNKHARDTGLCPNSTPKMREARRRVGLLTQNITKSNPPKRVIVRFDDGVVAFNSCRECARELNVSATYVSALCKTKKYSKKIGGVCEYEGRDCQVANG